MRSGRAAGLPQPEIRGDRDERNRMPRDRGRTTSPARRPLRSAPAARRARSAGAASSRPCRLEPAGAHPLPHRALDRRRADRGGVQAGAALAGEPRNPMPLIGRSSAARTRNRARKPDSSRIDVDALHEPAMLTDADGPRKGASSLTIPGETKLLASRLHRFRRVLGDQAEQAVSWPCRRRAGDRRCACSGAARAGRPSVSWLTVDHRHGLAAVVEASPATPGGACGIFVSPTQRQDLGDLAGIERVAVGAELGTAGTASARAAADRSTPRQLEARNAAAQAAGDLVQLVDRLGRLAQRIDRLLRGLAQLRQRLA